MREHNEIFEQTWQVYRRLLAPDCRRYHRRADPVLSRLCASDRGILQMSNLLGK